MNKLKTLLRNEVSGWKAWEVIWLSVALAIIIALGIFGHDTAMGIVSSTTGLAYSILSGKGKLSAYLCGLINATLYAIISYKAALYGETMLNAIYYVPMMFVGFFTWAKHMNDDTKEVRKRKMKWSGRLIVVASIAAGTVAYGFILKALGDTMPFIDAFTTVASVVAMIVSVRMFVEQWVIWEVVNLVTVYMWLMAYLQGGENLATLVMWALYIVNGLVMLVKWQREIRSNQALAKDKPQKEE